jgi:SAM-dependent methyltransferase
MVGFYDVDTFDWRQAWIERSRLRRPSADALFWDSRASEFSRHAGRSPYAIAFIESLVPKPGQSILDVGAGSGTLALPLASAGHEVFAVDFSPKMIQVLEESAQREGLASIRTAVLDFNAPWSEWEACGITENCVDIAIASRSTVVEDLWDAFEKLERAARSKVAITITAEPDEDDPEGLNLVLDGESYPMSDYLYAIKILAQMGKTPILRYIKSQKARKEGRTHSHRWAFLSWEVERQECAMYDGKIS